MSITGVPIIVVHYILFDGMSKDDYFIQGVLFKIQATFSGLYPPTKIGAKFIGNGNSYLDFFQDHLLIFWNGVGMYTFSGNILSFLVAMCRSKIGRFIWHCKDYKRESQSQMRKRIVSSKCS